MNIVSVYLHKEIIDVLEMFGTLDYTINKAIKDCCGSGAYNQFEEPPNREGAKRRNVVLEDDVQYLLPQKKIRAFIYWFVNNEVYSELEWAVNAKSKNKRVDRQFARAICELEKLNESVKDLSFIIDKIKEMRNNYGKK